MYNFFDTNNTARILKDGTNITNVYHKFWQLSGKYYISDI